MHSPNFIGVNQNALDSKNRLAVPSKFRLALKSEKLVLSQGLEGCLNLYPQAAWLKLNEKIESFPLPNKIEQRAFKRMLFSSACEVSFDLEGRILIPQALVAYAQIRKEAMVIGMGEKIEIWAKAVWELYEKRQRKAFEKYAEKLEL